MLPSLSSGTTPARMHILLANVASMLRDARTSAIAENRNIAFVFDADHPASLFRPCIYLLASRCQRGRDQWRRL